MNAAATGHGMFSQSGIFFMPQQRGVVAVFGHGASIPLKVVEQGAAERPEVRAVRRPRGAKWTFLKSPFFPREQRR